MSQLLKKEELKLEVFATAFPTGDDYMQFKTRLKRINNESSYNFDEKALEQIFRELRNSRVLYKMLRFYQTRSYGDNSIFDFAPFSMLKTA